MRFQLALVLSLAASLTLSLPRSRGAGAVTRPAVPDAAAQQKAMRLIDDVYRKDLTTAKTPERQAAVAEKLLQSAEETKNDAVGQYVLFAKVEDLAAGAGRFDLALKAVTEVEGLWDVDGLKTRTDLLVRAGHAVRGADSAAGYEQAANGVVRDAVAAGRFDLARRVADAAITAARAGGDAAQLKEATAQAKEISEAQEAYAKAEPAMARLKEHPEDPAANLAAGKYRCFALGDWSAGLPRLAAGSDPVLAAMAKEEAGLKADAPAQSSLADEWWNYAESQSGTARRQARIHAAGLYKEAGDQLEGLAKVKAGMRVKECEAQDAPGGLAAGAGATGHGGAGHGAAGAGAGGAGGRVKLANATDAKEGQKVIDSVAAHYPDLLKGVKQVELAKYHDGTEFRRHAGNPREFPGSYSAMPLAGKSGGIMLWGIYEKWPAGKYLVVYRLQSLDNPEGDNVCFCDVCKNGNTIAQRRPSASELAPGAWHEVPFAMELGEETTIEFRLWPNDHEIATDRVYVFRVQ